MPIDLAQLVSPGHTALVTQEVQRGVCGDLSGLPALADAARRVLPNMKALVEAARAAGVPVIHCVFERREDGKGANSNARIFKYMAKVEHPLVQGTPAVELCPEVAAAPEDIVLPRLHGVSPFQGTELDFVLRNLGVSTIVGIGVSVNVAMQNLAFDAVNSGYQVVLPRDAIAGYPDEYVEMVLEHTLNIVATLPTTPQLLTAWPVN